MEIRPYRAEDAPALTRLFRNSVRELGPRDYTAEQVEAWASRTPSPEAMHERLSDGRTALVAVSGAGAAIAFGDLEADGHIDLLFCAPEVAGTGVASALFERLESLARERGLERLYTEASEAARRLFAHKGFRVTRRRDFEIDGIPIHNYAMEKRLRAPNQAALLQAQASEFLGFLVPRVGSREAAQDLLQSAMAKALEKGGTLHDEESLTAWFYRLLRNALVDHYRRQDAERRALDGHARERTLEQEVEATRALERYVCGCVERLTSTVKPEYAAVVEAVDLGDEDVGAFAARMGITPGNARVRLHRARAALAARLLELCGACCQEGCEACPCDEPQAQRLP